MPRNIRSEEHEKLSAALSTGKRYKFQDLLSEIFAEEDKTDRNIAWLRQFLTNQCKAGKIKHEGREYFIEIEKKQRRRKKKSNEAETVSSAAKEKMTEETPSTSNDASAVMENEYKEETEDVNPIFKEFNDTLCIFCVALEKMYKILHTPSLYSGISRDDLELLLNNVQVVDFAFKHFKLHC